MPPSRLVTNYPITSQMSNYLIYAIVEAWNHTQLVINMKKTIQF